MDNVRLEQSRQDFENGKVIMGFYPITLANGFKVTEFTTQCNQCETEVQSDHFRGRVYTLNDKNTIVNQGVGFCERCVTIWPIEQRIKTHGKAIRAEWVHNGQWVRSLYEYEKTNIKYWVSQFKSLFGLGA
jgi:hypothetical protein